MTVTWLIASAVVLLVIWGLNVYAARQDERHEQEMDAHFNRMQGQTHGHAADSERQR